MLPICRLHWPPLLHLEVTRFPPASCHHSPRRAWSLQLVAFPLPIRPSLARAFQNALFPSPDEELSKPSSSSVTRLSPSHTSSLPCVLCLFQLSLPTSVFALIPRKGFLWLLREKKKKNCILSLGTKVQDAATTKERFFQRDSVPTRSVEIAIYRGDHDLL